MMEPNHRLSASVISDNHLDEGVSVSPLSSLHHSGVLLPSGISSTLESRLARTTHEPHASSGEYSNTTPPQQTNANAREPEVGLETRPDKPTNMPLKPVSTGLWKPTYLKKRRLAIFPVLFLALIVAIQILVRVSQENHGLATPSRNLRYLWTFGPMAILTLVAAFWARVEFQIKSVTPWAHMVYGQSFDKTLLLDYLAMLQPVAVVKAVKYRDWAVASALLCSLLLRIIVILSTALIVLTPAEIHNTPVPVTILSRFVDNTTELDNSATGLGSLPYYSMLGLSERNLSFPDGTSSAYAFQQFALTTVPDAHLNITVEGFTSSLACQSADLNTSYSNCDPMDSESLCWALETQKCQFPIRRLVPGESDDSAPSYYGTIGLSGCNNSSQVDDLGVYMIFSKLRYSNGSLPVISQSTQITCQASYQIDPVDVISTHTGVIQVSKSKTGSSRQITDLKKGRMLDLYLQSFETPTSTNLGQLTVDVLGETGEPEIAQLTLRFGSVLNFAQTANTTISSLFNHSFLEGILSHHYQQDAVFIARSVFSAQTSGQTTGMIDLKKERLIVSPATGHTITAFLSVALILSISVILTKLEPPSLPKSPNSVIRTVQLLADSKEVLNLLRGAGPASLTTLRNRLRGYSCQSLSQGSPPKPKSPAEPFHISVEPKEHIDELHYLDAPTNSMRAPLVLNQLSLISVQIIIVGTIVALEVILRISGSNNDFVDVSGQEYLHLAWTILPALFFSLISMYFAAVDSEIRSLTPFFKLSKGSSLPQMAKLDLLDGSTPRLLWREYRTECFAALATTSCLLMSSLFTIFVGSLYSVVTLPIDTSIRLQTDSSFNITGGVTSRTIVTDTGKLPDFSSITTTLILQSNLSYPPFTYETLALPVFSITNTHRDFGILSSDAVNTTIPALRSKMSCTRYSSSEIHMEILSTGIPGVPASHQSNREVLTINLDGTPNYSSTIPTGLTHNVELPLNERPGTDWVFGIGEMCNGGNGVIWCNSDFLYVWGHKTNSTDQSGHVAALMCNESIEAVDALTTFFGPELRIDPSFPPLPINDSSRMSTVNIHDGSKFVSDKWLSPYAYLAEGVNAPGSYLWPFFNLLTSSRYSFPFADLDNPDKDESVARAIIFQHGIIRAQVLNEGFRGPANMTNATLVNPPANLEIANDAIAYDGTVSRVGGRSRLAQDSATTRILEALLIAVLVLSSAGRLLMPNVKLLPRNATSIANVAALVADGNILSIFPENAQLLSDDEIATSNGSRYVLRLGWWTSSNEDSNSHQKFGIFAVKTSDESVFD